MVEAADGGPREGDLGSSRALEQRSAPEARDGRPALRSDGEGGSAAVADRRADHRRERAGAGGDVPRLPAGRRAAPGGDLTAAGLVRAAAIALGLAGAASVRAGATLAPATPRVPSWSEGAARPFLAGQLELGTTEHVRAVAGWGRPWWLWGGLLADGWANESMASFTVGGRAELLLANLEVHRRVTRNWRRVPMAPLERHTEVAEGGGSTLHAWDLDAWGAVPTPGGYVTWEVQATRLLGLPRDVHVFDEGVHAIVQPPWSGLASLGWVADLARGTLNAGGSADVSHLGRGDARRVRAGPMFAWTPSPRWTLRGQLLVTLSSPDALPAWDGLAGGLTVGYRTASGAEAAAGARATAR